MIRLQHFKIFLFLFFLNFASSSISYADLDISQDVDLLKWRAGLFTGFNLNQHFVDFKSLPNVPSCCPEYKSGFGAGFSFGGFIEFPLLNRLKFAVRAEYSVLNGVLAAEEKTIVDNSAGQAVAGIFEHTIDSRIDAFKIEPILNLKLNEINLMFGFDLTKISTATYSQSEKILEPSDIRYDNDQRTRMNYSGNINPINKYLYGLEIGFGWDFNMDYTTSQTQFTFSPEVFYHYSFTNFSSADKWMIHTLSLGIAVKYNKYRSQTKEIREESDSRPEKNKKK